MHDLSLNREFYFEHYFFHTNALRHSIDNTQTGQWIISCMLFLFASLFRSLSLYFWILLYHIKSISFGIFSKKISVSTDSKTRLRKQECVTHRRFAITMNLQWHYKIETDSAAFKRLSGTPFVMVSSMAFFYVAIVVAFAQWFSPIHIFSIFFFNSEDIITGFALGQMLMLSIWKVRPQYLNHRWLCRDSQRQWQI